MGNNLSSLLANRTTLREAPFQPPQSIEFEAPKPLQITVLFTDIQHTLDALKIAGQLAHDLHSDIRLVVPQVVPYPLPLTTPPVMLEFTERRFRVIAAEQATDVHVEIYLCRDVNEMLGHALSPNSTVIIGGAENWWPTTEKRLARRLRRQGHEVIFVPTSPKENMKKEDVYA